jgi:hypothetical protein
MAQRRMFNKSITNSSIFLRMPVSSRLLYYDLGMNADDDGFVEHFMVLKMTGATQQDLGVLELNGLIKVFDDNVLWIKDWKENNYIQKDRYTPSKYLAIYSLDTLCIQNGNTGKDSIGKISIDNNIYIPEEKDKKQKYGEYQHVLLTDKQYNDLKKQYNNYEELIKYLDEYIEMKGYKAKNHYLAIKKWVVEAVSKIKKEPTWFNKEIEKEEMTKEELQQMEQLMSKYK